MHIEWNKKYTTISVYAITVFLICFLLYKLTESWTDTKLFFSGIISMLSPILIGMLVAYFMNFLVNILENSILSKMNYQLLNKPNRKRRLAIFMSYLLVASLILFLVAIIVPQFLRSIMEFVEAFQLSFEGIVNYLNELSIKVDGVIYTLDPSYINTLVKDNLPNTFTKVTGIVTNLIPNIISLTKELALLILNTVLSIIISIYLLASKESVKENAKKTTIALFPEKSAKMILTIATYTHKVFARFFIGKLVDSFLVGILCFLVLLLAQMPFPLILSAIVGIMNIIPYFGPFIGGGIGLIFLIFVDPMKALWFLVIIIILQQFDSNILEPKIVGGSIGLSPFWIIFSIILFGNLFGFIGLLLGSPVFCVIKALIDGYLDNRYQERINNKRQS